MRIKPGLGLRWAVAMAMTVAAIAASAAHGQCGEWIIGPGQGPAGMNAGSTVRASVVWDPDGEAGPQPPLLVVGGEWHLLVTPELLGSVVAWDGTEWRGMGLVFTSASHRVSALAVYNGELIAGGVFPDGNIRRWDGAAWQPLGSGLTGAVHALAVYNGELVAAGNFTAAGGEPVSNIARWDGSQWGPLGSGVDAAANALLSFGGVLVVGGSFNSAGGIAADRVASWNGSEWSPLGGGIGTVQSLGTWNGSLIVGAASGVYQWSGLSWLTLRDVPSSLYLSIQEHQGDLIVTAAGSVHRWNGSIWQGFAPFTNGVVYTLAEYEGELIAGGAFTEINRRWIPKLARWDGEEWRCIAGGLDAASGEFYVSRIAEYDGGLAFAGAFNRADGVVTRNIAAWSGSRWSTLAGGPATAGVVRALTVHDGALILGGTGVWRWNGLSWTTMSLPGTVSDLLVHDGELFAANDTGVHRWTGSGWAAVGVSSGGWVTRLALHEGRLIASGSFSMIGGVAANRIAAWDGTQWTPLGLGVGGEPRALLSRGSDLFVGGHFTTAGGAPAARIARWDGSNWHPLGAGVSSSVSALASYGDALLVGGAFTAAAGVPVGYLAIWDGMAWQAIGSGPESGVNFQVLTMVEHQGEILVGGGFLKTGGRISHVWGRLTRGVPFVTLPPHDVQAAVGGSIELRVEVGATGSLTPIYRWRRDGVDLSDGPTPHGSTIAGASAAVLAISGMTPADAGVYDVVISTPCGESVGGPAAVTVAPNPCSSDWNNDGEVNSQDISAFLMSWLTSVQDGTLLADFNGDGQTNSADISAFLTAWLVEVVSGC